MTEIICLIIDVGASSARPLNAPGGQNVQHNGHNGQQNGHREQPRSFLEASLGIFLSNFRIFLIR